MVRVIVAALFAVLIALPAMAQDDYPRIEMSLGYANLGFPANIRYRKLLRLLCARRQK